VIGMGEKTLGFKMFTYQRGKRLLGNRRLIQGNNIKMKNREMVCDAEDRNIFASIGTVSGFLLKFDELYSSRNLSGCFEWFKNLSILKETLRE
jgi:hypothetical protein